MAKTKSKASSIKIRNTTLDRVRQLAKREGRMLTRQIEMLLDQALKTAD